MEEWRKQLEDHVSDMDRSTDIRKKAATTLYYKYQTPEGELLRKKLGESIRTSEKYQEAIKNRDQSYKNDPEFAEQHAERMRKLQEDPEFIAKRQAGVDAMRNDPQRYEEYLKNNREGYLKSKQDPQYWEKYYAAIKERESNPEYIKKRKEANKKAFAKPVRTPLGVFESQTDATKAHGFSNTERIRHRIKSPNFPDYQEISIEDYLRHK